MLKRRQKTVIPTELKLLVDKLVTQKVKDVLASLTEELQSAKNEINQLKTEITILKEGENI